MRDFRDAKAMARSLRDALKAKAIETTHTEALELIASAFGYANWNILSAKIEAAEPDAGVQETPRPKTLYCTFCGKTQHEVKKLIAGPSAYVCDECVELCVDIIREEDMFDKIFSPLRPDEERGDSSHATAFHALHGASNDELQDVLERGRRGVARQRRALQGIEQRLAMRPSEVPRDDDLLALPALAYLKNKSRDELLALQQATQVDLKRYEDGLRIAMTVLVERGEQAR
jgi:hypothetical protein